MCNFPLKFARSLPFPAVKKDLVVIALVKFLMVVDNAPSLSYWLSVLNHFVLIDLNSGNNVPLKMKCFMGSYTGHCLPFFFPFCTSVFLSVTFLKYLAI